jgi:hypothetical protein
VIQPVVLPTVPYRHVRRWQRQSAKLPGQSRHACKGSSGSVSGSCYCQHWAAKATRVRWYGQRPPAAAGVNLCKHRELEQALGAVLKWQYIRPETERKRASQENLTMPEKEPNETIEAHTENHVARQGDRIVRTYRAGSTRPTSLRGIAYTLRQWRVAEARLFEERGTRNPCAGICSGTIG